MRTLWPTTELGLEFDHVPYAVGDPELRSPEFLALNPFGMVPTIVDDGFTLSESLAINLHLIKKHADAAHELYIDGLGEEARIIHRTLWVQGTIEPWVQRDGRILELPEPISEPVRASLARRLDQLQQALSRSRWLLGDRFTLADLNVASVLSPSPARALDLANRPGVRGWLDACYARPAATLARQRHIE